MHIFCEKKNNFTSVAHFFFPQEVFFFCEWLSAQTLPGMGYILEYELFYVTSALIDQLKIGSWQPLYDYHLLFKPILIQTSNSVQVLKVIILLAVNNVSYPIVGGQFRHVQITRGWLFNKGVHKKKNGSDKSKQMTMSRGYTRESSSHFPFAAHL